MIVIIDYNMGNVGSIRNMLRRIGVASEITSDPARVEQADQLILPGVGAFDAGMANLERSGLIPVINQRVHQARVPTLGICLGMQLMMERSAEGTRQGLSWVAGEAERFQPTETALKVPHMGWNAVHVQRESPLIADLPPEPRFYFVHSYYVRCREPQDVLLRTHYGIDFDSAFQHGNIWGVQFHPEKSHKFGMGLLKSFAERCR
jgi:imidazole glycerol-phosphate synthase subunit HisH